MVTTPEPILRRVSAEIGESNTDTSSTRITYFNEAYQFYLSLYRWNFKLKSGSLTTTSSTEYDLTSEFSDYSTTDGVYLVKNGSTILTPIDYTDTSSYESSSKQHYYLTPDGKKIGFVPLSSGTTYTIWYFAVFSEVSNYNDTLNIPIPEAHIRPITTYVKHIVFDRKRQRNDARNMILDFQEQLTEVVNKEAGNKSSKLPKTFASVRQILGLKRNYQ